ncbi:MAG TPA: MmcB family DNA repair protein [Stellaceae bacterium]|nr:MmcB family DNA repair protein [Stellaceae bacterium]
MTDPRDIARELARGVARALAQRGFVTLAEVPLANGRRADLLALGRDNSLLIVEIKSSVVDFKSDRKWPDYRAFCDRLAFAVPADFPQDLIPEECGLIVADPFGAVVLRDGLVVPLAAARRKALTLRFARVAAARMQRFLDPGAFDPEPG